MIPFTGAYGHICVVCGPDQRCDQPSLEGIITAAERHVHPGRHETVNGVRVRLNTADGACLLDLGERYSYLAAGLAEAPEGLALRAYHLRRPQSEPADSGAMAAVPRFLTSASSLVVLEPDWLVDVTALTGIEYCLRQWLANRLVARPLTLQQLRGTAVHACFERVCRDGTISEDVLQSLIRRAAFGLALTGKSSDELLESVEPHLKRLVSWHDTFGADLFADALAEPCFESTLLCPELGLRGRIDLVLRRNDPDGAPRVTRVVELKTSKYNEQWPDPEFQVRGYYAILASQQRLAPDFRAQVIYTGAASVAYRHVGCGPEHVDHIVSQRNQAVLALLVGHAPPTRSLNRCRMSTSRSDCVQISALLDLDSCNGRDLQDAASAGIDKLDADFYATQYRLLRLEARATSHELATLWRSTPADREAAGTAVVLLQELSRDRAADGEWRHRFRCRNNSELRVGETVLLSDGDPVRGEATIATVDETGNEVVAVTALEPIARPVLLDRYFGGEPQDRTLRGLHAWMRAPRDLRALLYMFRAPELAAPNGLAAASEFASDLNRFQVTALDLAMRARDYLLVQGPPGTGKTHLIARIVQALVARGERVIISAWTNQAVDTMLYALQAQGFNQFARLGSGRSVDPSFLPYTIAPEVGAASTDPISPEGMAERLRTVPVLAGTVSGFADQRIEAATLERDVVILDEAAQLSVAAAVGVMRLARRFILVGDDQQLPPVVQSEDAAHEGLSLSPFALLRPEAQAHGAFVRLSEQFRMHSAIAAWPSEAFYDGTLTAHPSVATRQLPPRIGACEDQTVRRDAPVVIVDSGASTMIEADLAARTAIALVRSGVPAREVGVVAPFRATVAAVRRLLDGNPEAALCTVDTVDRFQGGQREAMIVCLGMSGIGRRGHSFVDDPRRLNVAFTRARAKLIVIGDLTLAGTLPTLAGFLQHCIDHGMPIVRATEPTSV